MTLTSYRDTSSMTLIISVKNDGSAPQMMKDLDDALTLVEESTSDEDLFYATIDVSGTWRPGDDELEPWDEPFLSAWKKVVENPAMHQPLAAWLDRVANLVKVSNELSGGCLGEHDEVQFGEVPATLLAFADKRFISIYTKLVNVWDMDHAVSQFDVVEKLLEEYGDTPETQALAAAIEPWT